MSHDGSRARTYLPPALAACGAVVAMAGVSAGAVPEPGFDRPVWYALVALVVGYWLAFVRLVRARR